MEINPNISGIENKVNKHIYILAIDKESAELYVKTDGYLGYILLITSFGLIPSDVIFNDPNRGCIYRFESIPWKPVNY